MRDDKSKYILPIGMLALTYFFGTQILQAFGLLPDDRNKNLTLPGGAFDPNFWKLKRPATILGYSELELVENIYDSVHWYRPNEPAVFIGVMQLMQTKAMVSHLCETFQTLYGIGLIPYLSQYLRPAEIEEGARIVSRLPDYVA